MSREFHVISPQVWTDDRFVALPDDAKLLFLRLLTGPEATIVPGVIGVGRAALAEAMKWSLPKFDRAWKALVVPPTDDHRFPLMVKDWDRRIIWLPRAAWHRRPPKNPNEVIGWRDAWRVLPDGEVKQSAATVLAEYLTERGAGLAEAFHSINVTQLTRKSPQPLGSAVGTPLEQISNTSSTINEPTTDGSPRAPARARSDSYSESSSGSPPEIAREIPEAPARPHLAAARPETGELSEPPPAWWSAVVDTVRTIVPVNEPPAWWFEYRGAMARKGWPTNQTHAVGWLTSAARNARDKARRSGVSQAQAAEVNMPRATPPTSKYGPSPLLAENESGEKISPEEHARLMSEIRTSSFDTKSGLPPVGEADLDDFPTARGLRAGGAR